MVSFVVGFILFLLFIFFVVTLPLPIALPILFKLELIKLARELKRSRPPHGIHILGVFRERDASASFAAVSASVDWHGCVHGDGMVCCLYLVVDHGVSQTLMYSFQKPVPLPQDVLFFFFL